LENVKGAMMRNAVAWAIAAVVILISAPVWGACGPSLIYLYDQDYEQGGYGDCGAELVPGTPLIVHVLLESYDFPHPIQEVNFRIHNWIGNPGYPLGQVTEHWTADQVSGSLEDGITLVWEDGLGTWGWGGVVRHFDLGYLEIEAFSPEWVEGGHVLRPFDLHYVDVEGWTYDGDDEGNPEGGSLFTFGGGSECLPYVWDPPSMWRWVRHVLPEDGALVPSVFPLQFQVICVACELGYWYPFEGTVYVEGEQIAEFSGDGVEGFNVTVDASEFPPFSKITVGISVYFYPGETREYTFEYTISDQTSTESINLSLLKSLYR
jgi:hypothetical protein